MTATASAWAAASTSVGDHDDGRALLGQAAQPVQDHLPGAQVEGRRWGSSAKTILGCEAITRAMATR